MWRSGKQPRRKATDPAQLTLGELMATQPRHVRGKLMPGDRFPTGMRPGRRRAQGTDLDSIGPYVAGDDVRWMDWRATARTGRAQMKRFIAESHMARMLIIDLSPHMMFGTGDRPMAKTAALLAANLAWEAFVLQEPVGMVLVPGMLAIRPRRGRGHILFMLKHLEDHYAAAVKHCDPPRPGLLAEAADTASTMLGSGDEIVLFSDFGGEDEALSKKVRELSGIRRFRAVVVEDEMFHTPLEAGRYPYVTADDQSRALAAVPRKAGLDHEDHVEQLRSQARRRLIRDGWLITEAGRSGLLAPGSER